MRLNVRTSFIRIVDEVLQTLLRKTPPKKVIANIITSLIFISTHFIRALFALRLTYYQFRFKYNVMCTSTVRGGHCP